MNLFLLLFLGLNSAFSAMSDNKVHLKLNDQQIEVNTDNGFHINQEAPAKISVINSSEIIKPKKIDHNFMSFDITNVYNQKFVISFYVCDDKNTSCELHKNIYEVKDKTLFETSAIEEISVAKKSESIVYNEHHFIKNNLPAALSMAIKQKKLLFVDFAAPWCPACVRLETEVFKEKSFQKLTKNLIKVSLNSDLTINSDAFKKYDVKLLPTLVILNTKGEELYRMIDFKPLKSFNKELKFGFENFHTTTDKLTELANKKDKAAMQALASRSFVMNNYPEALKWYTQLGEDSIKVAISKISVEAIEYEKNKKNEAEYATSLKKYILIFPNAYEALDWRISLAEIDKTNAKITLAENINILSKCLTDKQARDKLFANTTMGPIPFPLLEAYSYLVKSYDLLKEVNLHKKALEDFRMEISKIKTTTAKPGELMMIIQYQREAKMPEEENSLKTLVNAFPENHVFHMKLGNFYIRSGNFKDALPEMILSTNLEKPVSLYNLFLLAKVQKNLNLKDDMKKTIELADNLPESKLEKSAETIKSIHDLLIK